MNNSKKGILVLIILLAIGFAAVTATLVINGTSLFSTNDDGFDVIFTKAIIDGVNKTSSVISEDGKSITYTTKELAIKDDASILEFTVKNTSTQYDAEVSIECIGGESVGTYYKIDKEIVDYIPAQASEDGNVVVTMIKSSTEPIEEEFTCTITANAVERTTVADPIYDTEVTWSDEDDNYQLSLGDIVTLSKQGASTEQFYIINSNEKTVEMLSMYNLYVGNECTSNDSTTCITYESSLGIQDSTMIGYNTVESIRRGVTAFSSDEQKGENYSDYTGSIVEKYVNNYSEYLLNTLEIENTATLITKAEVETIVGTMLNAGDNLSTFGAPAFLYSTSYWTSSVYDTNYVWYIYSDARLSHGHNYDIDYIFGVRPLVTIDIDLLEVPSKVCNDVGDVCWIDIDYSETKTIGDVITLGTNSTSIEQFYILNSDDENIKMMSMYNLYVGGDYNSGFTAYINLTGIQEPTMKGWLYTEELRRGTTAFSSDSQKGENYSDYSGSIVEGYINNYSAYLTNALGIENTATAMSKEELEEIVGQTLTDSIYLHTLGVPTFLYNTSYWLSSAYDETNVWYIGSGSHFNYNLYSDVSGRGVRPVVIIASSLI